MFMRQLSHLLSCLRFFTRVPWPALWFEKNPHQMPDFCQAGTMVPAAGLLTGSCPAFILFAAQALGLPPILSAPLALLVLIVLTGALHEDGLADCADGFGGGNTHERKLEIMKDSRIGTYGAVAIVFSLYIRGAALFTLASANTSFAAAAFAGSGGLSRTLALLPLALLQPVRQTGAGFAGQGLSPKDLVLPLLLASLVSLLPALAGMDLVRNITAVACAGLSAFGFCRLAKAQIGGQTGDVAGAVQNLSEIVFLLVLASAFKKN